MRMVIIAKGYGSFFQKLHIRYVQETNKLTSLVGDALGPADGDLDGDEEGPLLGLCEGDRLGL